MTAPTRGKVIQWALEADLITNYDLHNGLVEVRFDEVQRFAELAYAAGFEAGKKDACLTLSGYVDSICCEELKDEAIN